MMYDNEVSQLLLERNYVKTYVNGDLDEDKIKDIINYGKELSCKKYDFSILEFAEEKRQYLGITKGTIKGTRYFVIGILQEEFINDVEVCIEFGYNFEKLLLRCVDLGFDTYSVLCDVNNMGKNINIGMYKNVVRISPLGVEKKKKGLEKICDKLINFNKNIEWGKMFFYKDIGLQLDKDIIKKYSEVLETLRNLAISLNNNICRVIYTNKKFNFYYMESNKDKNDKIIEYSNIGIYKLYFDIMAKYYDLKGNWVYDEELTDIDDKYRYVFTWKCD